MANSVKTYSVDVTIMMIVISMIIMTMMIIMIIMVIKVVIIDNYRARICWTLPLACGIVPECSPAGWQILFISSHFSGTRIRGDWYFLRWLNTATNRKTVRRMVSL